MAISSRAIWPSIIILYSYISGCESYPAEFGEFCFRLRPSEEPAFCRFDHHRQLWKEGVVQTVSLSPIPHQVNDVELWTIGMKGVQDKQPVLFFTQPGMEFHMMMFGAVDVHDHLPTRHRAYALELARDFLICHALEHSGFLPKPAFAIAQAHGPKMAYAFAFWIVAPRPDRLLPTGPTSGTMRRVGKKRIPSIDQRCMAVSCAYAWSSFMRGLPLRVRFGDQGTAQPVASIHQAEQALTLAHADLHPVTFLQTRREAFPVPEISLLQQTASLRSVLLLSVPNGVDKSALVSRWLAGLDRRLFLPLLLTHATLSSSGLLWALTTKLRFLDLGEIELIRTGKSSAGLSLGSPSQSG